VYVFGRAAVNQALQRETYFTLLRRNSGQFAKMAQIFIQKIV